MRLLKWQNTDKGKDFIKQGIEQGAKQERERNDAANAARDSKMADFLRSIGVSEKNVETALAIK